MSMIVDSNKLECRKVRKPKIEKLRRARINSSLESLKEILLRNTISIPQGSRPTKLEKADILEMTVRYIEMLHEKLSIYCEKPEKKSMEIFQTIQWNPSFERTFSDITNRNDKSNRPTEIIYDDKTCYNNRNHLYRQSSRDSCDKENFTITIRHDNQLMLGEHCWRPW
ncbi:CLUMA_CG021557, isoform A [Clunio marinus]|uniref:CLUMA_CG021557, isoform A n=1 Tax=Clunio marinus TaxID=568069 RepID=A0A1J1JA61_9DIPT|nr:CLUMA_CG021557, isoform A [Clunio marinus]